MYTKKTLFRIFVLSVLLLLGFKAAAQTSNLYSDENDNLPLPFQPTQIVNGGFAKDTKWYRIRINGDKYWVCNTFDVQCTNNAEEYDPATEFCFVGNNVNGFRIYCRRFGVHYVLYCASDITHEPLVPTDISYADAPNTFKLSPNKDGYNLYYPTNPNACINDLSGRGTLALWTNTSAPTNTGNRCYFEEVTNGTDDTPVLDQPTLLPVEGIVKYYYMKDGGVLAFPEEYVEETSESSSSIIVRDKQGTVHTIDKDEVQTTLDEAPSDFAQITSFKFNNKFNDMLMVDADATISVDGKIDVQVGGIGKRLVPSFKVSGDNALVYVGAELQHSKKTGRRFTSPTTYTVTRPGCMMLRLDSEGNYDMYPFGRDYSVEVDYLCDHPSSMYGVPSIYINTYDGSMVTSRDYYWDAVIKIDGAGYFPDMDETDVLIKGRGNSSWSYASDWYSPKNPYRIKFLEKQKPLGMKSGKSWNLIANNISGSMTTNMIGSRIAEMVGCAGANHFIPVDLYLNGEYRGSYCLTEKVGFSNNSIDLEDESNAVMLELDSYYDAPDRFKTVATFNGNSLPVNIQYPELGVDATNLKRSDITYSFNSFVSALKNGEDIRQYVDIPALARFLMVNDMIVNQELMHPKSTFLYNADVLCPDSLYVFGPAWDFDWAFGYESSRNYFTANAESDYYTLSTMEVRDFIYRLRYSGEETNKYYYRVWTDFVRNHLSDLLEYCTDYYQVAKYSFEHDKSMWNQGGSSTYESITKKSIAWLEKRAKYVYSFLSDRLGYADMDYLEPEPDPEETDILATAVPATGHVNALGIFDMQGRRYDSLHALKKGIYIIDGRKTVVK